MQEKVEKIIDLFKETGTAHHQAFIEEDGFDPDWPNWYAGYLVDKLPPLLQAELTRSELVYLLVRLDKEIGLEAPGANWQRYYARYLVERYL